MSLQLFNRQSAEEFFLALGVIIQHRVEQALAKSTGATEELVHVAPVYLLDEFHF